MAGDAPVKASKAGASAKKATTSSKKTLPPSSSAQTKQGKYKSAVEVSSSEDEEEETTSDKTATASDSDSGSDSDSSTSASKKRKSTSDTPAAPAPPETHYTLPAGATPIAVPASASENPFSAKNLEGKQIWLITAPANVPLQNVLSAATPTTFPSAALRTGQPVLEYKSTRYGLTADDAGDSADENDDDAEAEEGSSSTTKKNAKDVVSGLSILIPREGPKGRYKVASIPITKSLHLTTPAPNTSTPTHLIQPSLPEFSAATASISLRPTRPPRDQPEGLKMRFHPFGAGAPIPGDDIFGGEKSITTIAIDADSDIDMGGVTPKRRKVSKDRHESVGKSPKSSGKKEKEKKHKKANKSVSVS
ncbi:DNA-directed RNA polymerase I subunit RPA34.5-domain-containing protein [Peziza echinospora]|nr:DNA-directed RNA polymerase I subunit RPA34.5-domain-containing protein [Peziza echinospora]